MSPEFPGLDRYCALDAAGAPYIMTTASPVLRRKYPNSCANVEDILREIG